MLQFYSQIRDSKREPGIAYDKAEVLWQYILVKFTLMWSFCSKISEYPFSFFTGSTTQMSLGILQIFLYHCDHTSTSSLSSIKAYAIQLLHSHDALLVNWDDYVMPSGRTCHTEWLIYIHWSRGYFVSQIRTEWNDLRLNTRLRITCNL